MTPLVINFHGLGEPHSWVESDEAKYWLSKSQFEFVLDWLADQTVPFKITFDDGNISDLAIALPALSKRRLNAHFFVCSGRLGEEGYLDGKGLLELASEAKQIGTHGKNHVPWTSLDHKCLNDEVLGSSRALADVIGRQISAAAIPFGRYNRRVLTALKRAGISEAYSSDGRPRLRSNMPLPRMSVRSDVDIEGQLTYLFSNQSGSSLVKQELRATLKSWR